MSIVVNTNTTAMNSLGHLNRTNRSLASSFGKISSGMRITRAADDAAGLGVAENLKSQGMSARQAARNINDGLSMISTYESAANEIGDLLKRQKELAVQASSETLADTERAYIQDENEQIKKEWDRIADTTKFNGISLANGIGVSLSDTSFGHKKINVQVGIHDTADDRIEMDFFSFDRDNMKTEGDYGSSGLNWMYWSVHADLGSVSNARNAMTGADDALTWVNMARSEIGAVQNRLESALNNLETFTENSHAAESRIRDADFAHETAKMSKFQVMQQAGVAILGQANGMSQGALRLI